MSGFEGDSIRFDPFRRTDDYGEIGTGPHSWHRKLFLYTGAVLLIPLRATLCLLLAVNLRLLCALCSCLPFLRPWLLASGFSITSRAILFSLGFFYISHRRITVDPDSPDAPTADKRSALPIVVVNHVSWVDILTSEWLFPGAGFVTREETKKTPLVGGVCKALPCIFVDRDKTSMPGEQVVSTADKIANRTRGKAGNPESDVKPLIIFPEGTTSNGKFLLPFKTGAFVPGVPVQPILVHYPQVKGYPSLAWETIAAPTHAFLAMSCLFHKACVTELPLYTPTAEEKADARLFAGNVHMYMAKWAANLGIDLRESSSGLTEKRQYHSMLREKHAAKR